MAASAYTATPHQASLRISTTSEDANGVVANTRKEPSKMQVSTIGLDLAKQVFQVHGVDAEGTVALRRRLRRSKVVKFFSALSGCLVGIEACATAHHWARELSALGHR